MIRPTILAGSLVLALAAEAATPAIVLRVIDGDTITAELPGGQIEKIRIVGLDAPERGKGARCRAEAALAERAKSHLAGLLRQGPVAVEPLRRVRDRWGRPLAVVMVAGRDVASQMINAALARPYRGGRRQPWC